MTTTTPEEIGFIVACELCGGRTLLRTPRTAYLCPPCREVTSDADEYPLGQVRG